MSLEKGICLGGAKVIDFHLKGCMVGQKCKNNITGRYPRFPKNIAGQKAYLELSTYLQHQLTMDIEDYRKNG